MNYKNWDEGDNLDQTVQIKRKKLKAHELEELRDHVEHISFNIEKVYRLAKVSSKKEFKHARQLLKRKIHHTSKNEKSGFKA